MCVWARGRDGVLPPPSSLSRPSKLHARTAGRVVIIGTRYHEAVPVHLSTGKRGQISSQETPTVGSTVRPTPFAVILP